MVYSIPSTQHSQLKIPVTIGTLETWAMVDSGATGNFLSEWFVRDNQIQIMRKVHPYRVGNADGSPNAGDGGWVLHKARM